MTAYQKMVDDIASQGGVDALSPEQQAELDRVNQAYGAQTLPAGGGGNPDALQAALGHWAHDEENRPMGPNDVRMKEERHADEEAWKKAHPGADIRQVGGWRVGQDCIDGPSSNDPDMRIGDLSSASGRVAALDRITQNASEGVVDFGSDGSHMMDPSGDDRCGPAAIIGGALLADGPEGLNKVINGILAAADSSETKGERAVFAGRLGPLAEKLGGKGAKDLTLADVQLLQQSLYEVMNHDMDAKLGVGEHEGVADPSIKSFVDMAGLSDDFKANHLRIANVDTDGELDQGGHRGNHAVLTMGDAHDQEIGVYDPFQRHNGQIVTDPYDLHNYSLARDEWVVY